MDKIMIEKCLNEALKALYKKDLYLIRQELPDTQEKTKHVSERGIVFRFGIYFEKFMKESGLDPKYSIDVEYNRNMEAKKMLPDYPNGTYPDMIVHERASNKNNLLILEFKTWWNNGIEADKRKIEGFMDKNGIYKYQYGAVILLEKEIKETNISWIEG